MSKLTEKQIQTFHLLQRSPRDGDGWAVVSKVVWPLLNNMPDELIEKEIGGDSYGRVRLTETGLKVVSYLV